jgi:predicted nucleotide-binding protein
MDDNNDGWFYHVRITTKSKRAHALTRTDMLRGELEERFLRPYYEGAPIVIGGHVVPPNDLDHIRISRTRESSPQIIPRLKAEDRMSAVGFIGGPSYDWRVADSGEDLTDKLITRPPGGIEFSPAVQPSDNPVDKSIVFVVSGRDLAARNAMFSFLRSIHLNPLEWIEAVRATAKTTPYVGDILHAAFKQAQAVVVLMTPDDEAKLRESLQQPSDPPHEKNLTPQARPNVLFEAGMAMATHEDRTILVELGTLRPFTDIGGLHVIRLDNTSQRRQELADRLRTAGCPVNLGGTDWHAAGDFVGLPLTSRATPHEPQEAVPEAHAGLKFGEPQLLDHGILQRTQIRGAFETSTGTSGPRHRVSTGLTKIRNWQIPITNHGAPVQDAKIKLIRASPEIQGVSAEVTLHVVLDDPPLENYRFRRTFSLHRDETILIDVVAMDEQKPEICYLWNVAYDDAVQEVKLGGTRKLTLRAYAGDVNFEEDYEIYGDASSARLDMKGPLQRPAQ